MVRSVLGVGPVRNLLGTQTNPVVSAVGYSFPWLHTLLERTTGLDLDEAQIGRIEDIAVVARVLDGRTVRSGVSLVVTPGSRQVFLEALRLGYVETITRAGGLVTPPGCGSCLGTQGPVPASGDRVLTTMNRNFLGRMGNPRSEIYLSSPVVAAHAAILGHVPSAGELT